MSEKIKENLINKKYYNIKTGKPLFLLYLIIVRRKEIAYHKVTLYRTI